MSVVGFDFGNQSCYVSIARQGGIEVLTNDYSLHATPSCVIFGDKSRTMGVAARQQMSTKLKSAVTNFKHLLGRNFSDPIVQEQRPWIPCELVQLQDDKLGLKVEYLGESRVFTPEQVTSMLFVKLREVTEAALKGEVSKVNDCVVSVPCYFTDAQRRALLDSTRLAGLNCLRIFNETTAVALAYGIYKADLPAEKEKPRHVVFVDVGHAASQACVAAFNKGKLTVLGTAWDIGLGGRALDATLADHFCTLFKEKYKVDARSRPRAWLRLLDESEKVKKQMSANSTPIPLNVECFLDDKDVSSKIQRSEFEELGRPFWERIRRLMLRLMQDAKMKTGDVDCVELVGGSARIPMIKQIVQEVFHKEPMTTMNMDEAVSRGCAMQCAVLSPKFRVREFGVTDAQPFRIKLEWTGDHGEVSEMDVFEENHAFPYSKMLTFFRTGPFELDAAYALPNHIPFPKLDIGRFKVMNVVPGLDGTNRKVKVKVRINPNGLFSVSSAAMIDKVLQPADAEPATSEQKTEPMDTSGGESQSNNTPDTSMENGAVPEPSGEATSEPTEKASPGDEEPPPLTPAKQEPKKPKYKTVSIDLPIEEKIPSQMDALELEKYKNMESELMKRDLAEKEKADAKNGLEEYVYDMRDKLCDSLATFVTEKDSSSFSSLLQNTEDWLYGDGDDVDTPVYVNKYNDLRAIGDPIVERWQESEARKPAFETLGAALVGTRKAYEAYLAEDEKYDHLEAADMERVRKILEEKQAWMHDYMNKQQGRPLTEPPAVFAQQIYAEKDALEAVVRPVLNKPKPKPKVEEPKEEQVNGTAAPDGTEPPPLNEQQDKTTKEQTGSGDNSAANSMEVD